MATPSSDTLSSARKLKAAGFSEEQAEVQAEALRTVEDENLATRQDIESLRRDMKEMESRIVIPLGGMMVIGFSVLVVLIKVL